MSLKQRFNGSLEDKCFNLLVKIRSNLVLRNEVDCTKNLKNHRERGNDENFSVRRYNPLGHLDS